MGFMLSSPRERRYADLPIIVPEVKGCILQSANTILDVGGREVGARVLLVFKKHFKVYQNMNYY